MPARFSPPRPQERAALKKLCEKWISREPSSRNDAELLLAKVFRGEMASGEFCARATGYAKRERWIEKNPSDKDIALNLFVQRDNHEITEEDLWWLLHEP